MSICTNCHGASSAGCYVCNPEAHPDIQYGYNLMTIGKPVTTQLDRIEAQNLLIRELLTKKKTVSKPRASKDEYSEDFLEIWQIYPARSGANPKKRAATAFEKRISEGLLNHEEIYFELFQGARRYAKFCDATGKTGTEYVMQAATFFGPDRHYENDWTIPAPKTKTGATEIQTASHDWVDFNKLREAEKALVEVDRFK